MTRHSFRPGILALAAITLAAVLVAGWGLPWLTNDSLWALVWGGEIADGQAPSLEQLNASTPHPLTNLVAAALSVIGPGVAYWGLAGIAVLSFAAIAVLTFAIGSLAFNVAAGAVAAVLVVGNPTLLAGATSGLMDLPFMALVLLSVYLEMRGRQPRVVLGTLAIAGLIRPEAWLFSGAYFLWVWASGRDRSATALVLTVAAPVLWLALDAAVTGNPLHSLTHTQEGARELRRTTGLANVPTTAADSLRNLLTGPVLLAGALGFVAAVQRKRALPILALGALAGASYVALGVANLSLLERYLALPAIVLMLTFGYAATGWAWRRGTTRLVWAAAAVLVVGYALTLVPERVRMIQAARETSTSNARLVSDLRTLTRNRTVQDLTSRCDRIVVRDQRPRALLIHELGLGVDRVVDGRTHRATAGDLFVTVSAEAMRQHRYALFPAAVDPPPADPPDGFETAYAAHGWTLLARGDCR